MPPGEGYRRYLQEMGVEMAGGGWLVATCDPQGRPRFCPRGVGVPDTISAGDNMAGPCLTPGLGDRSEESLLPTVSTVFGWLFPFSFFSLFPFWSPVSAWRRHPTSLLEVL